VLNGILWVLLTGAPWADLPEAYPSFQTCHRRFQQWVRSGVMKGILEALALDLKLRGAIDVRKASLSCPSVTLKTSLECFTLHCCLILLRHL
jgi:transposase